MRIALARSSLRLVTGGVLVVLASCSPEARRIRDGGPGADPGNKVLVATPPVDPKAADTTLWPGKAPAPVDRLAAGERPPAAQVSAGAMPAKQGTRAVTPSTPPTSSEQGTFGKGGSANPRRPSSRPPH